MANQSRNHSELVNYAVKELKKRGYIAIKTHSMVLKPLSGPGRIRVGFPGLTDITCCSPFGRFVAIEVKTGTGRLSNDQKEYRDHVLSRNGLYLIVRKKADIELLA